MDLKQTEVVFKFLNKSVVELQKQLKDFRSLKDSIELTTKADKRIQIGLKTMLKNHEQSTEEMNFLKLYLKELKS